MVRAFRNVLFKEKFTAIVEKLVLVFEFSCGCWGNMRLKFETSRGQSVLPSLAKLIFLCAPFSCKPVQLLQQGIDNQRNKSKGFSFAYLT